MIKIPPTKSAIYNKPLSLSLTGVEVVEIFVEHGDKEQERVRLTRAGAGGRRRLLRGGGNLQRLLQAHHDAVAVPSGPLLVVMARSRLSLTKKQQEYFYKLKLRVPLPIVILG